MLEEAVRVAAHALEEAVHEVSVATTYELEEAVPAAVSCVLEEAA